jgi:hypothetical protein
MLKSANMLGFFLMASLITLSVSAALIGNMNLFSDAMASEKHSDKNYKYQEDEKNYYSNEGDNKYSPDYNYYQYYQPMQQQDEQSGYNNNNYGYDNDYKDKTISYNTSYEDMKTYSTYPTKDKKYVCQTGQFQGFYVESVEFCKLEIPAGPQGPQGPQGPAGQINFTNTYRVVGPGATITSETPSRAFSVSLCDPGDIVLEGGGSVANFLDEGLGNVFQIIRETVTVNEQNGYRVGGVGSNLTSFDSNAICIDNPPLRP